MGNLTAKESGEMVNIISPNANNITSFKVYFSPKQEGTGDPTPNNVRPITGWNGLTVKRTGKNLYDETTYPLSAGWISGGDGQRNSPDTSTDYKCTASFIPFCGFDGKTIVLNKRPKGTNPGIAFYSDSNNNSFIGGVKNNKGTAGTPITATVPNGTKYMRFCVPIEATDIQIELGSESTSYEPFKGTTIPVDWTSEAGTLYGGYVDLVSGELVVTAKSKVLNGSEGWSNGGSVNNRWRTSTAYGSTNIVFPDIRYGTSGDMDVIACSHLTPYVTGGSAHVGHVNVITGAYYNPQVFIGVDFVDNLADWKAWLAENPMTVVYRLATPVTYQLTPQQINTFSGINNFWSNADYVEIEYELTETFDIQKAKRKIILNQPHVESTSGTIAKFDTDMTGKVKECKINFLPVQSGTGDPSPTNVRPVSGWTGLDVKRTGKNLYDISSYPLTSGIWIHGGSGYTAENNSYASTDYIPFKGYDGQTITLNKRPGGANPGIAFYDYRQWYISGVANAGGTAGTPMTAAVPLGTEYMRFTVPANSTDIQLEIGTEATAYEPYSGETFSIDWANDIGTVYSGYLDIISGKLVKTWEYRQLTGNENWSIYNGSYAPKRPTILNWEEKDNKYHAVISDKLLGTTLWSPYLYNVTLNNGGHLVIGMSEEFTSKEVMNDWIQSLGGIDIVYPLVTPVVYQLTPQQIKTLRGINNIASNANGEVEIKYWTY